MDNFLLEKKKEANFSLRLPGDVREKLQTIADKEKVKPAHIVRRALEHYFNFYNEEQEIKRIRSTKNADLPMLIGRIKTDRALSELEKALKK